VKVKELIKLLADCEGEAQVFLSPHKEKRDTEVSEIKDDGLAVHLRNWKLGE
jgi:hypothetical protein